LPFIAYRPRTLICILVAAVLGPAAGGCGGDGASEPDAAPKEDVMVVPPPGDATIIVEEVGHAPPPDAGVDAPLDAGADLPADARPDAAAEAGVDGPAAYPRPVYQHLEDTGYFGAEGMPAGDLEAFEPAYALWSDGAVKRRWVRLPPGTLIDTSDMDHWQFPIGTKLWKEFARDGVPLETRLIERYGAGAEDYWMGAFVWSDDGKQATYAPDGASDVHGTTHDVPAAKLCGDCHRGDKGRVLGLSALQLSHDRPGLTLDRLAERGLLTDPPPAGAHYAAPGDPTTAAALGYLHANCGHCHNENGASWPDTQMVLRLVVAEQTAADSAVFRSLVGRKLQSWRSDTFTTRVVAGDPGASALIARMKARGSKDQMPSLATEVIDPAGIAAVEAWISSLPP
jgi:hypothetical protein